MAKKKQEVKLKEPVRIRFKQLANATSLFIWTIIQVMLLEKKIMLAVNGNMNF